MSSPTRDRLLDAWRTGLLAELARKCSTQDEMARALGLTSDAYRGAAKGMRETGMHFPSWGQLKGIAVAQDTQDFESEEATQPTFIGIPDNDVPTDTSLEDVAIAPPGFSIRGESTLYGADGEVRAKWVKTKADESEKYKALLDAMASIADKWTGLAEPIPAPSVSNDDILCVYPLGDPHIGLLSWKPETGNDFDLKIAERNLCTAIDHLVTMAPPAKRALVISLGDMFHADSKAATTTAGTSVDVDGRWAKVLGIGIRVGRYLIDRTLEKHERVDAIIESGNHDWHTSAMLAICLSQFYENEPRVTIDTSPAKFHYYRFGKVLIGTTHGDTVKLDKLGGVMACDKPHDWGETLHRYWYTGHIHHDTVRELPGCTVESFRTLAPGDAWHMGQGYRSGRDMKLDVLHREHGRINRHIVGINQIVEAA